MSSLGLNASIYRVTKKYSDLLDHFVIDARTHHASVDPKREDETLLFFTQLIQEDNIDPQIQMIGAILEKDFRVKNRNFTKTISHVLDSLNKKDVDAVLNELEIIASALGEESSIVLSRMQGSSK
jgi:hypothetical protein